MTTRRSPTRRQRLAANRPEDRDAHRVAIPAAPTDRATFAALVRHELEHARQFDAGVRTTDLHDFILYDVLREVACGLDGCGGSLVNAIPTEIDCNAAASVYVGCRFSAAEMQAIRDGPRSCLACSLIGPPSPETLPARMVAFAYIYRAAVERCAKRRGHAVAQILGPVRPKAAALWAELERGM